MAVTQSTIFSAEIKPQAGATKTIEQAFAEVKKTFSAEKIDFALGASQVGGILTNFTPKTLYMEASKTNQNDLVLSFCEKAFSPVVEKAGKYIEKKLQYIPKNANYSREAFIPSASNSNTTVGTLTSIRRDVDKLWVAQQLEVADAVDQNMIMNRLDFEQTRYTNILMGAAEGQFPLDSFATQPISVQTTYANWCLQGHDFQTTSGTVTHKQGLLELYNDAVANKPANAISVNDIDLTSDYEGAGCHYVTYVPNDTTSASESRVEAMAQLNQLFFLMQNPNKCFAYSAGLQQSAQLNDLVAVATNQTIEGMKAADVNYFKELAKVFNPNNLLQLPETTFDTTYVSTGATNAAVFAANVANISASGQKMAGGDILIYEKELFQRFSNAPFEREEEYFKNARTISHYITWRPSFDLLADRAYCVFSAPVLVSQYSFPIIDTGVTDEPDSIAADTPAVLKKSTVATPTTTK